LKIEDYALIGDCHSAALVGRDGSIDWLCWPRFDSAACFAALLGKRDHGRWRIAPVGVHTCARRSYRGDSLILETEFETAEGAVTLIDFMPTREDTCQLVRIVLGRRGHAEADLSDGGGSAPSFRVRALVPWAIGFLVYQWSVPTALGWWTRWMHALFHGFLHLPFPLWSSAAGGSIPSFAVAFALAIAVLGPSWGGSDGSAGGRPRSSRPPAPSTRS